MLQSGVNVITGGNHTWDKKEGILAFEEYAKHMVRPANAPLTTPGKGGIIFTTRMGYKIGIINLMGRIFMDPMDCPFYAFDREYELLRKETPHIFVDIHAEASSEKAAMGWHTDGRASVVVGTHTHVQTADDRIFPKGTGFLTDAGMNGPLESIIGMKKEIIVERFLRKMPIKMEVAEGPGPLCGAVFELDSETGRCLKIHRLHRN
jgi:metallophosphoesterase (TIGR00282 family)